MPPSLRLASSITRSLPRSLPTPSQPTRLLSTLPLSNPRPRLPRTPISSLSQTPTRKNHNSPDNHNYVHRDVDTRPLTDRLNQEGDDPKFAEQNRKRRAQEPAYQIVFTCRPCGHRSAHHMSKQGYHHGTVVIRCPSCANRHVMSDHLKIFFDTSSTLEDILKDSGGKVTRGYLEGDMEFWEDGSVTKASGAAEEKAEGEKTDDEPKKLG